MIIESGKDCSYQTTTPNMSCGADWGYGPVQKTKVKTPRTRWKSHNVVKKTSQTNLFAVRAVFWH